MRTWLAAWVLVSVVACDDKRTPTSAPVAASASSPAPVSSPGASSVVPSSTGDAAPREAPLTIAPVASAPAEVALPDNAFVTGFPGGALRIYAVPTDDARTSDVLLQVLGEHDAANGPPRKIRRTSGSVAAISAFVEGTTAWVAWRSQTGSADFAAVMRVSLDTFATTGPRMVGNVSALAAPGSVRIISDGSGGALLGTNGPEVAVPCLLREETPPCRGPSVLLVHVPADFPAHEPRVLATRGLDGGPVADVRGLSLVGQDRVFLDVRSMHGGAITDAVLVPLVPPLDGGTPVAVPVPTPTCGLLDRTYVQGDRIIAIADDGYWQESETCPTGKNPTFTCPTVGISRLGETREAGAPPPLHCAPRLSSVVRCEAGRQVEHLRYKGGEVDVTLDRPCHTTAH